MALWPAKKDPSDRSAGIPADAAPGSADDLQQLTEGLGELGRLLDQANQHVAAYLIRREADAVAATGAPSGTGDGSSAAIAGKVDALAEKFEQLVGSAPAAGPRSTSPAIDEETFRAALQPLLQKIEAIESVVRALGDRTSPNALQESVAPLLGQINDGVNAHHQAVIGTIGQLQQRLDGSVQHIAELLRPPEPEPVESSPGANGDWQHAILGSELADNPNLAIARRQLLDGMFAGEKAACSLVGQLIVFRSAAAEKMSPLLKEIGEAYYRWQPKAQAGTDPMEEALAAWLKRACDEAGIGNTIELVHPGERFDSTRHSAAQRGVEITQVLGWIVLRDNGRVYTKANVTVR